MTGPMRSGRRVAYRVGLYVATLLCLASGAYACWETFGDRLIDDGWSPRLTHASASNAGRQIVTQALVDGRLTFADAVERFENLSRHNPYFPWSVFEHAFPGVTADERAGRQVIAFVAEGLKSNPEQAHAMTPGLEAQLYRSSSVSNLPPSQ
jgi:hypothetical protein